MSTALVRIESMTGIDLFKPGMIDPLFEQIEREVRERAAELDISTETGRKEMASLAYKIARSKTFVDEQRKKLVTDEKKRLKAIDEEGARIWDKFEALQKDVRKPLTEWENAEKNRVVGHEEHLRLMAEAGALSGPLNLDEIEAKIERVMELSDRPWEEFAARAAKAKEIALFGLDGAVTRAKEAIAQREELERLRKAEQERAIKAREEAAAKAAREDAERKAAEQARQAREAAEKERQRVENERIEAEARAKQAEARVKSEAEESARRASEAAVRAEQEKEEAVEAERARAAAELKRKSDEAAARERNKAHKGKINREARDAIMRNTGLEIEGAESVIEAIAKGSIPNVSISY